MKSIEEQIPDSLEYSYKELLWTLAMSPFQGLGFHGLPLDKASPYLMDDTPSGLLLEVQYIALKGRRT